MLHFRLKLNENQKFSYTPEHDNEIFVLVKRVEGDVESIPISSERPLRINAGDVLMFESYDSVPDFVPITVAVIAAAPVI